MKRRTLIWIEKSVDLWGNRGSWVNLWCNIRTTLQLRGWGSLRLVHMIAWARKSQQKIKPFPTSSFDTWHCCDMQYPSFSSLQWPIMITGHGSYLGFLPFLLCHTLSPPSDAIPLLNQLAQQSPLYVFHKTAFTLLPYSQ